MARSSYIYVVESVVRIAAPLAAFTVKHELVSYLRDLTPSEFHQCSVHRLRDGVRHPIPVHLTKKELLG